MLIPAVFGLGNACTAFVIKALKPQGNASERHGSYALAALFRRSKYHLMQCRDD